MATNRANSTSADSQMQDYVKGGGRELLASAVEGVVSTGDRQSLVVVAAAGIGLKLPIQEDKKAEEKQYAQEVEWKSIHEQQQRFLQENFQRLEQAAARERKAFEDKKAEIHAKKQEDVSKQSLQNLQAEEERLAKQDVLIREYKDHLAASELRAFQEWKRTWSSALGASAEKVAEAVKKIKTSIDEKLDVILAGNTDLSEKSKQEFRQKFAEKWADVNQGMQDALANRKSPEELAVHVPQFRETYEEERKKHQHLGEKEAAAKAQEKVAEKAAPVLEVHANIIERGALSLAYRELEVLTKKLLGEKEGSLKKLFGKGHMDLAKEAAKNKDFKSAMDDYRKLVEGLVVTRSDSSENLVEAARQLEAAREKLGAVKQAAPKASEVHTVADSMLTHVSPVAEAKVEATVTRAQSI